MTTHLDTRTTQSPRAVFVPYMPYLDGLRALAVGAVVLYHADIEWLPGGFLGVDLFFVLSGYLITTLLLTEWQVYGTIDIARFWLRRARRLLPALLAMIAATLGFALIWRPDEVARLRGDAVAALMYGTNWYLIFKHESYFEAIGPPSQFQHLWSLAIEEQFYILWPPALMLALQRFGRSAPLRCALVGIACSAALMAWLYQPDSDSSRVYYGTDTRAFAPLLGAALACAWPRSSESTGAQPRLSLVFDSMAFAALAGLVAAWCLFDEYQPLLYQGGFVVVALLSALGIGALTNPAALVSRCFLSSQPLRWLGTRSYAIYLWHWPIYLVTRPELDLALAGWPLLALRLGVTLLVSEASYRFVEAPVRSGALERAWRELHTTRGVRRWRLVAQWVATTIAALAMVTLLGVAVVEARPPAPVADERLEAVIDVPLPNATLADQPAPTVSVFATAPSPSPAYTATPVPRASSPTRTDSDEWREHGQHPHQLPPRPTPSLTPAPTSPPPEQRILAVGDSVMVGTAKELRAALGDVTIDAAVSRQAKKAIAILRARRDAGQLGDVVIVHIGTNGPLSARQFDEMMSILADVRRVVFVTVKVPRRWEKPNNAVISSGVERYANAVLADWHAASAGRPELFARDGVHPTRAGARLFGSVIAAAVRAP